MTTITIKGALEPRFSEILTPAALDFVAMLDAEFAGRRTELLAARELRDAEISGGAEFAFADATATIREGDWQVASPAPGLEWRDCEITGPPTRTMTVNAMNCPAAVWMADFEDANAPTWSNIIGGQLNLLDAIRGRLDFVETGRRYSARPISPNDAPAGERTPTIVFRPRGWHLAEKHLVRHGRTLPAALVDFGLYFFHNAQALIDAGRGPYFYLPKLESPAEARLWNDIFVRAQDALRLPHGTVRATVLIETLPAAFAMDEILYELREHSAGLNAGRWDYLFSAIRAFAHRGPQYVFPDRAQLTMTTPFLRAYTDLLVATCHRRGAHAIGGMAAFVPSRRDPAASRIAMAQVAADKRREAGDGFDGSWVAHPDLIDCCRAAFAEVLKGRPHQLDRQRPEVRVVAGDLTDFASWAPEVTLQGLRTNIRVTLAYLAAWVGGAGAVAIDHLMEDAATVEISRAQLWQWTTYRTRLAEGMPVTPELIDRIITEETRTLLKAAADAIGAEERLRAARDILTVTSQEPTLPRFFTPYAYAHHLAHPTEPFDSPMVAIFTAEPARTTGGSGSADFARQPAVAAGR